MQNTCSKTKKRTWLHAIEHTSKNKLKSKYTTMRLEITESKIKQPQFVYTAGERPGPFSFLAYGIIAL